MYAIYLTSLPARERKNRDALELMISSPDYLFIVANDADVVVGLAIVFAARPHSFSLLEYLAVDERRRGAGIGDALFRHVLR